MPEKNEQNEKLQWTTPVIEEIDFVATEAAFINPGATDAAIYSH